MPYDDDILSLCHFPFNPSFSLSAFLSARVLGNVEAFFFLSFFFWLSQWLGLQVLENTAAFSEMLAGAIKYTATKNCSKPGAVAHTCNPSYLPDRDQENPNL
jgi:hypothetical protein